MPPPTIATEARLAMAEVHPLEIGPRARLRWDFHEGGEVRRMVDVEAKPGKPQNFWLKPGAARGLEMRKKTVVAEFQRHCVGGRAQYRIRAALIMRRHDDEVGRAVMGGDDPRDFLGSDERDVAWDREHRALAFAGEPLRRGRDCAGLSVARALAGDVRAIHDGERHRRSVLGYDDRAREA